MLSCSGIGDSWCDLMIPSRLGPTRNAMSSDFCNETEGVGSLMKAVPASKVISCVLFCVACLNSSRIDFVFPFPFA